MNKQIILSAKNVTKTFQEGKSILTAVNNACFDIYDGSFVIIYGPSGSGKSTLLNCLVGLDSPDSGSVTYAGKDLFEMDTNERAYFRAHTMGMVHQANYWVKSLNVLDNVALPLTFLGFDRDDSHKLAMQSLERVKMQNYSKLKPTSLSGGEQQRIAMARATVNNPTYIVADEPTGNLDSKNGDDVIELLRYFNKELLRTVILVTHNLEYLPVGDKLMSIDDGVINEIANNDINSVTNKLIQATNKRIAYWGGK